MSHPSAIIAVLLGLACAGCRASDRAGDFAAQTPQEEQRRLWEEVARRGSPPGLRRLEPQRPGVQPRQPPQLPDRAIAAEAGALASGVVNGIRLVSTSQTGSWEYMGSATVTDVSDERVEVIFGGNRTLVFVARLNGKPLPLMRGDVVTLVAASNAAIFDRRALVGVRTAAGAEIISAIQTGRGPVMLTIAMAPLNLVFSQIGTPINGAMDVSIQTAGASEVLRPGNVVRLGALSVSLLGSFARPAAGTATDISPYGIDVVVWRP